MFLYLRDCSNKAFVGDFEYAVMALSPLKGFLGHTFFSPFLESVIPHLYPCRQRYRLPDRFLNLSDYIVFDRKLFDKLDFQDRNILYMGKEIVFVRNIKHR